MSDRITVEHFDIGTLDVDQAIREAEAGVIGDTRADFFRKAAVGGGAMIGGGVLLAGMPALAEARPSKRQDVAILNYALTLEYLESAFYIEAVKNGAISGEVLDTATIIRDHEVTHVKALKQVLGRKAVRKPKFDFADTTSDPAKFLATAVALEDTGVAAYNGQATNLTAGALAAAARIVSVEARHAAWIRSIVGKTPAADATDSPLTEAQVLAAIRKTGFLRS